MATIDSLEQDVAALRQEVQSIRSQQSTNNTGIHNNAQNINALFSRMNTAEGRLDGHDKTLAEHKRILDNHEERISDIENKELRFSMLPWKNECKLPSVINGSVEIYLPPYTKDELKEYNEDVFGLVSYKWYQKIFNPRNQGDVSFDFQDKNDYLESINLGPHSYICIPLPIIFEGNPDNRKLVIECCYPNLVCTTQFYSNDVKPMKEEVITLYNFSNSTINIKTGEPILRVTPCYGYNPQLIRK